MANKTTVPDQTTEPKKASAPVIAYVIIGILLMMTSVIAFGLLPDRTLVINNHRINATLADTSEERAQGLSGRNRLGESEGMVFVFNTPDRYCFWMKDMKFPIDIMWLDANKRVVGIEENVSPESYPQSYCPNALATYAVEVKAGKVAEWHIKLGDQAQFRR